ncbi:MAG TPA: hypothetical protein DCG72_05555 [Gammaproteobacteria bacterium]|nr:hypothetical protein [Gammaproteobacteria bacterium]
MRYRRNSDGSLEHRVFASQDEIEPGWVQKAEALQAPKKRGRPPKTSQPETTEEERTGEALPM